MSASPLQRTMLLSMVDCHPSWYIRAGVDPPIRPRRPSPLVPPSNHAPEPSVARAGTDDAHRAASSSLEGENVDSRWRRCSAAGSRQVCSGAGCERRSKAQERCSYLTLRAICRSRVQMAHWARSLTPPCVRRRQSQPSSGCQTARPIGPDGWATKAHARTHLREREASSDSRCVA